MYAVVMSLCFDGLTPVPSGTKSTRAANAMLSSQRTGGRQGLHPEITRLVACELGKVGG